MSSSIETIYTKFGMTSAELGIASTDRTFITVPLNEVYDEFITILPQKAIQGLQKLAREFGDNNRFLYILTLITICMPSNGMYENYRPYFKEQMAEAEQRRESIPFKKYRQGPVCGMVDLQLISPFSPLFSQLGCNFRVNIPMNDIYGPSTQSNILATEFLRKYADIHSPISSTIRLDDDDDDDSSASSTNSQGVTCPIPPNFRTQAVVIGKILLYLGLDKYVI
jgi:hypothetical protein